jgi:hypothetical protein
MLLMRITLLLTFIVSALFAVAQEQPVYSYWKDDTVLKKKFYEQTMKKKNDFIAAAGKEHAKDFKLIYDANFENIASVWKSSSPITSKEVNDYLQTVVQKIIAANPELKNTDARIVFTRDWWPNAASFGDGSIVVNAGLVMYLSDESELAFVICHELAHYYLDHFNQSVKKMVETWNSEEMKKDAKLLSKQKYGVGAEYEKLAKKYVFGKNRYSRAKESEADLQGFRFMKKSGYDLNGVINALQLLNTIDDTSLFKPFVPEATFNFEKYPFKKKWTQKQSAIFGQMSADESPLTPAERDSLKTHPDCVIRIKALEDSVAKYQGGKKFMVNETYFNEIKTHWFAEITEQVFRYDDLAMNLYYNLLQLQKGENLPMAVTSIARDFNLLYQMQKDHKLNGLEKESRYYTADYNLLLRMIDRLRLDEIASINYYFCKKYEAQMSAFIAFNEELNKAIKIMGQYQTTSSN